MNTRELRCGPGPSPECRDLPPGLRRPDLGQDEHGQQPWMGTKGPAPAHDHWNITTFVAELTRSPLSWMAPSTAMPSRSGVGQFLVPELRSGDIVVMDNLSSHKGPGVRNMIKQARAKLIFLQSCDPDFNPIEFAFSRFKGKLRKAAERTVDGLWNTIGQIYDSFKPQECGNDFVAAGYDTR